MFAVGVIQFSASFAGWFLESLVSSCFGAFFAVGAFQLVLPSRLVLYIVGVVLFCALIAGLCLFLCRLHRPVGALPVCLCSVLFDDFFASWLVSYVVGVVLFSLIGAFQLVLLSRLVIYIIGVVLLYALIADLCLFLCRLHRPVGALPVCLCLVLFMLFSPVDILCWWCRQVQGFLSYRCVVQVGAYFHWFSQLYS